MTRAEYLEFVQEALAFPRKPLPTEGQWAPKVPLADDTQDISQVQLRDTPEVCRALEMAHAEYCAKVETILFPERAVQVAAEFHGYKVLDGLQEDLN